jgi:AcrR family transcriptional regulator
MSVLHIGAGSSDACTVVAGFRFDKNIGPLYAILHERLAERLYIGDVEQEWECALRRREDFCVLGAPYGSDHAMIGRQRPMDESAQKSRADAGDEKGFGVRHERVLDAAEFLLAQGGAAFWMRELADEAGVSFATPFNLFGSKGAIMLALSARRIALMHERLTQASLPPTAVSRVLAAVDIAAAVMLDAPVVNRAVMGAIGAPGDVSSRSGALWARRSEKETVSRAPLGPLR